MRRLTRLFISSYPEPLNATGIADSTLPNQFLIDWVRVYQCSTDIEKGLSCLDDS